MDKFADIAEYTYNFNGIRTSKKANGFTTNFFLNDKKILRQQDASNELTFYYGADGITGFHLTNNIVDTDYFYKKNKENDIIGIYSTNGDQIAKYEYDAWGNCIAKYLQSDGTYAKIEEDYNYNDTSIINRFVAFKNPFRYRSYYYDFETNIYYLNSRYYDPETGRFVNADDVSALDVTKITINGLNLYAYCLNNPVNNIDENGDIPNWLKWLIGALIIVVALTLTVITAGGFAGAAVAISPVFAGTASGVSGFFAGVAVGAVVSGVAGAISGGISSSINGGSFLDGTADGFMWGAISGGFGSIKFKTGNFGPGNFGNMFQVIGQSVVGVGSYLLKAFVNNEPISFAGLALALFGGVCGGLLNGSPFLEQLFVTGSLEISNVLWSLFGKLWDGVKGKNLTVRN